jgi:hypothetical protein
MEGVRNTEEMRTMKVRLLAMAFGFFLAAGSAYAGPRPGGADTDGDTVENAFDNCTLVANPSQTDTDHNGCGNDCTQPITCDTAGDMNLVVGGSDQAIIGMNFPNTVPAGTLGDCDGNGQVGGSDLAAFGMEFLNMVGPSGITSAQCDPSSCLCTPQ